MSENHPCPLCGHQLEDVRFYVRWFDGRYRQKLATRIKAHKNIRAHRGAVEIDGIAMPFCDIVNLATGHVFRHDCKRKLPDWLSEPVQRAIVASTGDIPALYKKSAVEQDDRKKALDGKAVPA